MSEKLETWSKTRLKELSNCGLASDYPNTNTHKIVFTFYSTLSNKNMYRFTCRSGEDNVSVVCQYTDLGILLENKSLVLPVIAGIWDKKAYLFINAVQTRVILCGCWIVYT